MVERASKEIVVSRYNEDLYWVKEVNTDIKVYIYNKSDISHEYEYKQIPNIGREGETYLRHIVENYNNLSENIIFCQGCPFHHSKNFIEIVNNSESASYISDWVPKVFSYSSQDMIDRASYILNRFNLNELSHNSTFSAGAQYLIKRSMILSNSKEFWMDLYDYYITYLDNNDSSNPWIYERIWPIIFGLSNSDSNNLTDGYGRI